MGDYYFHLDHLSVGYNGKALINDIRIGINKGEIVTLIGPNGAGKSTILKTISRQLEMKEGRVEFDGTELREYSYRDLSCKMAVVLTERMRPELMTCHDVVATGRYPYTGRLGILSREDEAKVDEAMRVVNAAELGARDFNAISDGQRQRVLLARAICQEPDIILLDEPTSFLDIRHKLELLAILRRMAKAENITVIMSLHEIDLAMKVSDRILCIKGDHLFKEGHPDEIFDEEMIRQLYDINNGFFDPLRQYRASEDNRRAKDTGAFILRKRRFRIQAAAKGGHSFHCRHTYGKRYRLSACKASSRRDHHERTLRNAFR